MGNNDAQAVAPTAASQIAGLLEELPGSCLVFWSSLAPVVETGKVVAAIVVP
jgi:hypothetical protein